MTTGLPGESRTVKVCPGVPMVFRLQKTERYQPVRRLFGSRRICLASLDVSMVGSGVCGVAHPRIKPSTFRAAVPGIGEAVSTAQDRHSRRAEWSARLAVRWSELTAAPWPAELAYLAGPEVAPTPGHTPGEVCAIARAVAPHGGLAGLVGLSAWGVPLQPLQDGQALATSGVLELLSPGRDHCGPLVLSSTGEWLGVVRTLAAAGYARPAVLGVCDLEAPYPGARSPLAELLDHRPNQTPVWVAQPGLMLSFIQLYTSAVLSPLLCEGIPPPPHRAG